MDNFEIEVMDNSLAPAEGAVIKAIGVGGGGGNMINHMVAQKISGISLVTANTDAQALDSSLAPYKIQIGKNVSRGRGCGMVPDKGREAAEEGYEEIKEAIGGADLVFIAAGLGGGTGTGAAPVVARAAKEVGALTVSVVTTPFKFEGRKRTKLAEQGLQELKEMSDSIIVIHNERILSIAEKNLGVKESFKLVDDILAQAVSGISNVIISHSPSDINLDFADVRTVMSHRGLALMGVGHASGQNAAYDAANEAISSPLLGDISIKGAQGVLVHFKIHPDYPLFQISEAMNTIEEYAHEDASVIFGTTTDETMAEDEVSITIVATGFEQEAHGSNDGTKADTPKPANKTSEVARPNVIKVVGGENESYYDTPTYLRNQRD